MSITSAQPSMSSEPLIKQLKRKQDQLNAQLKKVEVALLVLENPDTEALVTIVLDAKNC